jgi:methylmalonyl-CoA mutase C-terminal domain/subunit
MRHYFNGVNGGREMKPKKTIRGLLGKVGLDGHDNGIRIVAKWLADSGMEITYLGLHNTAESIVHAAIQENVDFIGCSFQGGEHLHFTQKLLQLMKEKQMKDVKLIVGGIIPPDDVVELKRRGVAAVFTPGTRRDMIINNIKNLFISS